MGNDSSKQHRRWFEQIDAGKRERKNLLVSFVALGGVTRHDPLLQLGPFSCLFVCSFLVFFSRCLCEVG